MRKQDSSQVYITVCECVHCSQVSFLVKYIHIHVSGITNKASS